MSLRWFHRLGIGVIDKLIIAFALLIVSLDVTDGFQTMTLDLLTIILVVFACYAGTIFLVNILTLTIKVEGKITSFAFGIITAGFVLWLFPQLLRIILFLTGHFINADIEMILVITAVIRTFVRVYLGRRWRTVGG